MNLNNILKNSNFQERNNTLKKVFGIVKEVKGSNAVVAIQDSLNLTVTLPNKTSEPLKENDNVWVYYWNKISQGYIALKNDDNGLSAKVTDLICNHMEIGKFDISEKDCDTTAPYIYKQVKIKRTILNPVIFAQISYDNKSAPLTQKLFVHIQEVRDNSFWLCISSNTHTTMEDLDVKDFTVNYLVIDMAYTKLI